ncbi:MAG: TrkH family potassium uptake protein, partial [Huintestinicola sp.]
IYFTLTLTEFIILMISGMTPFEALNAAFSTAGTGGFGVKNDSMGGYTPAMQIIITVFMILFSINFNSYFLLISGKLKDAFNYEVRLFLIIVITSSLLIAVNVSHMFGSFGESLRHSAFTVASIISTTGFSTVDFSLWPEFSRTIIVLLMFIGACAGSTGGGIKVSRIIILFKGLKKEMLSIVHPKQVRKVKVDSHTIDHSVIRSVNVYMVSYLLIFVISLVIISFDNHDLITNFTSVAATINNIGPGLELVGPAANFGVFSSPAKIVLIFDMLAGRLELFPMLLLFTPETWKK